MEILGSFDLTGSFRDAAELAGCEPKTVAHSVARRDAGQLGTGLAAQREKPIDPYQEKIEEWMDQSHGKIRPMWPTKSSCPWAMAVRSARPGTPWQTPGGPTGPATGVFRPWVAEPGLWFQWDYGDGPVVAGLRAVLFCAWLAWSRFRVVLPLRDKTLPSVIGAVDAALRRFGGCPTYGLTDNEKTVTVEHVARTPVRNPEIVAAVSHYGLTVATCVPYDPEPKGGSEATVRVAKADLVPTEANLLPAYPTGPRWRRPARPSVRRSTLGPTGLPAGRRQRCSPRSSPTCTACQLTPTPALSAWPGGLTRTCPW